ncbi:MAG: molybdopterin molybdotransferase MoeA [Selenomonadaceae bacterium]|nr:molybdopterin molybdotransferase MoeA [Selenomonadaceae bacterium]MBR4696804.1 molybdopterin molybdotransferase MoeA [Selenomonadaceae bacterium]
MEGIELEQAVELLLEKAIAPKETEEVALLEALGRTLAEDMRAAFDNPPFDRSPLDGYAIIASDTVHATKKTPARLHIIGEECAGDFFAGVVKPGEALRIMTGGAMPKGTDAVIRQEDVSVKDKFVEIPYELRRHENYCFAGEDIKKGALLIRQGEVLDAPRIGVLASQGHAKVTVFRRPRIVLGNTGDELLHPGEPLSPGKIYNSNLYLLAARLQELGAETRNLDIIPDDPKEAADKLRLHLDWSDLLITTGGVSVGKKDIMHEVASLLPAQRIFWKVQMKPGYPLLAYETGNALGLALSGNPFAAYTTFELIARPLIDHLAGHAPRSFPRLEATLKDAFPKASHGRRFIRAHYDTAEGTAAIPGQHSSGSLFSAVGCNAFIDLPPGTGKLNPGDKVDILLL